MASALFAFRFRTTEYRTSNPPPTAGPVVTRINMDFVVHDVGQDGTGRTMVTPRERPQPQPET
jgi:hypothetical protein